MALNMTHKYTKTEVWPVTAEVGSGVAVVSTGATPQPGVTLTGSGAYTKSTTLGPYTISGIPAGGVGLDPLQVTVAVDGAFRFDVVGASASTVRNAVVYAVVSSGVVTGLTLTASTNIPFGKFDRHIGEASSTESSVWIGRFVDAT